MSQSQDKQTSLCVAAAANASTCEASGDCSWSCTAQPTSAAKNTALIASVSAAGGVVIVGGMVGAAVWWSRPAAAVVRAARKLAL